MAITIPASDRFLAYTATAGQTVFAYNFPVYESTDLNVFQISGGVITELTTPANFTVSNVGDQAGGNVTLVVGAALNDNIVIAGDIPELKSTNFNQAGDFYKDSVNTAFSKLTMMAQQLRRDVDRSIHLDPADITDVDTVSFKLPLVDDRKGKYLYFNGVTGAVEVNTATGVAGPSDSVDNEVALFSGTTGQVLKRPSTASMIIPQGTTAQRDVPTAITLRGNTDGAEDVEVYVNGGWSSVLTGGTGAPIGATYITQTPNGTLTNEQAMSALATGIVKNTTATGVQSIAVNGTDYISPTLQSNVDVNGNSLVSLANGDITIAPNGTGKTNITSPIVLTSQVAPAYADGTLFYSSTDNCLAFFNDEADITLQIGQENWIRVYNNSGATITNGKIVYVTGQEAVENRLTISLAQADSADTTKVIGVTTHDIGNNSFGFITQFGNVNDLNTAAFTAGDAVWLSSSSAGDFTDTEPVAPDSSIFMGFVAESDAVTGKIFITTIGNTSGTTVSGDASQLVTSARKGSIGTINIGDAVYISGYNVGQSVIEVELADSSVSGTMPAIGIASSTITNALTGQVTISGRIGGLDTSGFAAGDEIYVSETGTTGNTLINTKPTGVALIQKVGIVNRSNVNNGVITIIGAGRSNDIPNFTAADKYWYGAATGTSAEGDITAFGRSLIDDANAADGATTLGLGTGDNVTFLNGDFTGTEALKLPVGTTAQRPGAPADGDTRINTTLGTTEVYRNAVWRDIEAGSGDSGDMIYLGTVTGSNDSTVDIDSTYITTTYDEYELIINDFVPATDGTNLRMLTSTNNGTSFASANYSYNAYSVQTSASVYGTTSDDRINITSNSTHGIGSAAGEVLSIRVRISRPTDAGTITKIFWSGAYTGTSSHSILLNGAGSHDVAEDNDAFRFYMSSGNISTCTIDIYGIRNT